MVSLHTLVRCEYWSLTDRDVCTYMCVCVCKSMLKKLNSCLKPCFTVYLRLLHRLKIQKLITNLKKTFIVKGNVFGTSLTLCGIGPDFGGVTVTSLIFPHSSSKFQKEGPLEGD